MAFEAMKITQIEIIKIKQEYKEIPMTITDGLVYSFFLFDYAWREWKSKKKW